MGLPHDDKLWSNARELRKHMTAEERHLWYDFLRDYPVKIYRQKVIGSYIVDFFCDRAKLVIELDGSQHYEPDGQGRDAERTAYLESLGLAVVRYSNLEIKKEFRAVCESLVRLIQERSPRKAPLEGSCRAERD